MRNMRTLRSKKRCAKHLARLHRQMDKVNDRPRPYLSVTFIHIGHMRGNIYISKNAKEAEKNRKKRHGMMSGRMFVGRTEIGWMLFTMGDFPSLNATAEIPHTRGDKNFSF